MSVALVLEAMLLCYHVRILITWQLHLLMK
jgi:hypothetical protein